MRVLLTSAGLETAEIQHYFMDMVNKDMRLTNTCALAIRGFPNGLEIIGE